LPLEGHGIPRKALICGEGNVPPPRKAPTSTADEDNNFLDVHLALN
jgi:hypothetical protein